jgi:hypothetical protein
MSILSANPAVRKREEQLLAHARLQRIDAALDHLLAGRFGGGQPSPTPPAFSAVDVEEVGKLLVEGRIKLPTHARITVITTVEETRSKVFGTYEVFTHTADQLHTRLLRPMGVLDALDQGLIRRIECGWVWSETTYERLASEQRSADG